MSAAKHTPGHPDGDSPGPWVIEATDSRYAVMDASGGFIADTTDGFEDDNGWNMAAKSEHVARLIAAAPELLSLLQDALDSFAPHVEGGEADEWVKFSRAAIAKATGSAQ